MSSALQASRGAAKTISPSGATSRTTNLASRPAFSGTSLRLHPRLQAQRERRQRRSGVSVVAYRSPVHQKYVRKTKEELEEEYRQEWLSTTAHQAGVRRKPTTRSVVVYMFMYIRFCILPEPVRYIFHRLWLPMRPLLHALHKRLVLAGIKLDAAIVKRRQPSTSKSFSVQEVLRRYHGKASPWRKLVYRMKLLLGKSLAELDADALAQDKAAVEEEEAALAAARAAVEEGQSARVARA